MICPQLVKGFVPVVAEADTEEGAAHAPAAASTPAAAAHCTPSLKAAAA